MSSPSASNPTERTRTLSGGGGQREPGRRRTSSFGSFTRVVLIAVDTSDHARHAFEWYLANVWKSDDLLVLVHCPEAPKLPTFSLKSGLGPPIAEWKVILDDMNAKARKLEEDYEGTCTQRRLKYKMRTEAMKNIGEGILRIAEEETADLIVCGSKAGKGGFKGSTADYIMRNTAIPVLCIPTKY